MELIKWDKIRYEIETSKDIEELTTIKDKLRAYQILAEQSKQSAEVQAKIAIYKARADRKCGEWLKENTRWGGDRKTESRSQDVTLKDINITKNESSRLQKIASIPEDRFEEILNQAEGEVKRVTSNMLVSIAKEASLSRIKETEDDYLHDEKNTKVRISLYGENIYFNSAVMSPRRWDDKIVSFDNPTIPTITKLSRFFHADGTEFSLREYARVQAFPDTYKFVGNYSTIKAQIGNAVSPLMGRHIAGFLEGLTFVDLFAGCGGLSCGLEMVGKKALYAVEREPAYFQTYLANHDCPVKTTDIRNLDSLEVPDSDIIVGGPPCQGFSSAGFRLKNDPRNQMYKEFLRIVTDKSPHEFVMENVKEILEIKQQIIEDFESIGYSVDVKVVYGPDIGLKQTRKRVFFIGRR